MKLLIFAIACLALSGAGWSQSLANLDDDSISMDCALAIRTTVKDLEIRLGSDFENEFRGVKCIETVPDKIVVWIQPADPLSRGGGYLYEIERNTQRIFARNPQR
jgi:hypothetical protein